MVKAEVEVEEEAAAAVMEVVVAAQYIECSQLPFPSRSSPRSFRCYHSYSYMIASLIYFCVVHFPGSCFQA